MHPLWILWALGFSTYVILYFNFCLHLMLIKHVTVWNTREAQADCFRVSFPVKSTQNSLESWKAPFLEIEVESHSLHHQPPLFMTILSHVVRNLWPRAFSVHAVRTITAELVEKILGEFIQYWARKRQAELRWNCVRKWTVSSAKFVPVFCWEKKWWYVMYGKLSSKG